VTEPVPSFTGPDIISILRDMQRRKEAADKMTQVYFRLTSALNGNLDKDSQEAAEKILSGIQIKDRNLTEEIRQWVMSLQGGSFSVTECDKELQIVTKEDKALRRVVFHRLCSVTPALLERDKSAINRYKALHADEEIWTLDNVDMASISVTLPLNIHRKTKLFHGAIVTVGGVTGTGKTMFALNFIRDNMHSYEMYYLNSEMSKQELNAKENAFLHTNKSSWKYTIVNVTGEMALSVRKDKINIIDYLQAPSEKPFLIRDSLDSIKSRLGTGMALVLIQRKSGNPWGEGGQYSAHNASLYINLDWQTCEIMKNRFREADEFRGKDKHSFDIKAGNIVGKGGWYPADQKPPEEKYEGLVREEDFVHED
jgi:hypothetical protein